MALLRKMYIYIATLIIVSVILFFIIIKSPATKILDEFLGFINDTSRINLNNYITPSLLDDPFLTSLKDRDIIIDHKILKSQKINDNDNKVKASIATKYGRFDVWFIVSKVKNKWIITRFPKTNYIEAAVPLISEEKGKNSIEYQMDIDGTHLYCTFPSSKSAINIGVPTSLILIEDYIAEFKHLIPIHLNRIMSASQEHIEDALLGYIPIQSPLILYQISDGTPIHLKKRILPIGISDVTLYQSPYQKNKSLIAYIDPSRISYNRIRVALNNTGFQSISHDEIRITSTEGMMIKNLVDSFDYSIGKDEEVIFRPDPEEGVLLSHGDSLIVSSPNRWYIVPKNGGNLVVKNIQRAQTLDSSGTHYRGNMEISKNAEGLTLINEVDLEEYLYSVVPSEMPIKFGLESLKVQAIAARSYAVRTFESTGYASLGAHVDDSTASQMYNNIEEHPIAIQAVEQTRGLVPIYEDKAIDSRFFSTSCGYTANFHETWSVDDEFPSQEIPYLVAKSQFPGDTPSLHNEENFRAFIKQKNLQGYDQFSPFFRWTLTMSKEQIEAVLQKNLAPLQKTQSPYILTKDKQGIYSQQPIPEDLGQIQNIVPIRRGQGGNIMELEITTTSGIFKIIKELNIRQLLKPINLIPNGEPIEIKRHDGSIVKDFPILPSTFFYLDIIRDANGNISKIIFSGGGYGHGVGMSQYGAYGLSLLGKSYVEIIEHYYPGTILQDVSE